MAVPLIVLAIGSVFAGYVGVPHALGGSNRIEQFLHPSFQPGTSPHGSSAAGATFESGPRVVLAQAQHAEPAEADAHDLVATERILMGISAGVAVAGIGVAMFFWLRSRSAAETAASRFRPVHRTLLNKYYVDELYDAAIVQPAKLLSTRVLWRGADAGLIDGAVNGVGVVVSGSSAALRRLQTGSVRTYAVAVFLGVVIILAYFLARYYDLWPRGLMVS